MRTIHTFVTKALKFATREHLGQLRKDGKTPFIEHPIGVADILMMAVPDDLSLIAAAYLHDVMEESNVSYEELVKEFNEDIAGLVREVTKDGYNFFPHLKTRRGVLLKFADRLQNLSDMHTQSEEWQQRYIQKSTFWKV